ncbi:fibro-slime domain-containing protein [Chitinispirillales bacterium ANBcel5]|uniref:fibro-slime domain-containing protein n=1 Tax=Cellulosispirillum alkaliphilum TaxID=3039283 RepID=UPI002A57266C|nr:fibro-slime domain-containing protein [Chitinispirillales bacterium ANBcel5]
MSFLINRVKVSSFLLLFFISSYSFSQLTIHFQSPWYDDPVRSQTPLYILSEETGWWPGEEMEAQGAGWYKHTLLNTTSHSRLEFMSVIPTGDDQHDNRVIYRGGSQRIALNTLVEQNPNAEQVWISVSSPDSDPELLFSEPESRVVMFFNPWDLGFPRIQFPDEAIRRMEPQIDYCGWHSYRLFGDPSSLEFKFINSRDSSIYSEAGFQDGDFLNPALHLEEHDTLWLLPSQPGGELQITSSFPNRVGKCDVIALAATIRDINENHPDFQACVTGLVTGMVEERLGPDGKPVQAYVDSSNCYTDLASWFTVEVFEGGYTNEICHNLILHRNEEGLYEIDDPNFFPIDDWLYLDSAQTIPNPNFDHDGRGNNFHFSMEVPAQFVYEPGQTFEFRGDDDVWVFIDSQLVVDIGGVHNPEYGAVDLDTLGLVPGEVYDFNLFFVERHRWGSNLRIVTSIDLISRSRIFYKADFLSEGVVQYDLFTREEKEGLSCELTCIDCDDDNPRTDVQQAIVDFSLTGPSYPDPHKLPSGISYGGIIISEDFTGITIDENSITSLEPGTYTVAYYLREDMSQEGEIYFTVPERIIIPTIEHASAHADNGYGMVDRFEIYFDHELESPPDSIRISWPSIENSQLFTPDEMIINPLDSTHITINVAQPYQREQTTFATDMLGMHYTTIYQNNIRSTPFSVADSVGPLIKEAILVEGDYQQRDTLLLILTERVMLNSLSGESLLLRKDQEPELILNVSNVIPRHQDTIGVLLSARELTISETDSIRFNPDGPLTDFYDNSAHPENRPVPIKIRRKPPLLLSGYYRDSNGNGIVDYARLTFSKPPLLSETNLEFTCFEGTKTPAIEQYRLSYTQDSTQIEVNLTDAFSQTLIDQTSGNLVARAEFNSFDSFTTSQTLQDSAAPVLVSALYSYCDSDTYCTDTLFITFSEEVLDVPHSTPFLFEETEHNQNYSMELQQLRANRSEWAFLVRSLNDIEYPLEGDSVWINPEANVADLYSNVQDISTNKRVPLAIRLPKPEYEVFAGPNPFDPAEESLQIHITSSTKTRVHIDFSANITIYDNVGNIVHKEIKENKLYSNKIQTEWNGLNTNGRTVGIGSYLIVVLVEDDIDEETSVHKILIGVNR